MSTPKISFEREVIRLPLSNLLPVRRVENVEKAIKRFSSIMSSIQEVGVIEPLAVYPNKGTKGSYLIMDGNLRYHALQKLGEKDVPCIVADQNDSFTYNARICRMSPIQEHRMIAKAVQKGVSVEKLAATLNLSEQYVRETLKLLNGLDPAAVDILESHHMSHTAIRAFKKVTPARQIDMAEMMVSVNDFSGPYAEALLASTPEDMLIEKASSRKILSISQEEEARLRDEMYNLETDFKAVEESYSDNIYKLTMARGYLKKLLGNAKVVRWLNQHHAETASQFEAIVASESL